MLSARLGRLRLVRFSSVSNRGSLEQNHGVYRVNRIPIIRRSIRPFSSTETIDIPDEGIMALTEVLRTTESFKSKLDLLKELGELELQDKKVILLNSNVISAIEETFIRAKELSSVDTAKDYLHTMAALSVVSVRDHGPIILPAITTLISKSNHSPNGESLLQYFQMFRRLRVQFNRASDMNNWAVQTLQTVLQDTTLSTEIRHELIFNAFILNIKPPEGVSEQWLNDNLSSASYETVEDDSYPTAMFIKGLLHAHVNMHHLNPDTQQLIMSIAQFSLQSCLSRVTGYPRGNFSSDLETRVFATRHFYRALRSLWLINANAVHERQTAIRELLVDHFTVCLPYITGDDLSLVLQTLGGYHITWKYLSPPAKVSLLHVINKHISYVTVDKMGMFIGSLGKLKIDLDIIFRQKWLHFLFGKLQYAEKLTQFDLSYILAALRVIGCVHTHMQYSNNNNNNNWDQILLHSFLQIGENNIDLELITRLADLEFRWKDFASTPGLQLIFSRVLERELEVDNLYLFQCNPVILSNVLHLLSIFKVDFRQLDSSFHSLLSNEIKNLQNTSFTTSKSLTQALFSLFKLKVPIAEFNLKAMMENVVNMKDDFDARDVPTLLYTLAMMNIQWNELDPNVHLFLRRQLIVSRLTWEYPRVISSLAIMCFDLPPQQLQNDENLTAILTETSRYFPSFYKEFDQNKKREKDITARVNLQTFVEYLSLSTIGQALVRQYFTIDKKASNPTFLTKSQATEAGKDFAKRHEDLLSTLSDRHNVAFLPQMNPLRGADLMVLTIVEKKKKWVPPPPPPQDSSSGSEVASTVDNKSPFTFTKPLPLAFVSINKSELDQDEGRLSLFRRHLYHVHYPQVPVFTMDIKHLDHVEQRKLLTKTMDKVMRRLSLQSTTTLLQAAAGEDGDNE